MLDNDDYVSGLLSRRPDDFPVVVVGNLVAAPEMRYSQKNNTPYAKFDLAVSNPARQGEQQEPATFYTVTTFNQVADHVAQSLTKGDRVVVVGNLTWKARETDGFFFDIAASEVATSLRYGNTTFTKARRQSDPVGATPPGRPPMGGSTAAVTVPDANGDRF